MHIVVYNGVLWRILGQALIFVIIITLIIINTLQIINFCKLSVFKGILFLIWLI